MKSIWPWMLCWILACGSLPAATGFKTSRDAIGLRFRCMDTTQPRLCLDVLKPGCELKVVAAQGQVGEQGAEVFLPPEADDKLEVTCNGRSWSVRSAEDLISKVEIQSPSDAVEYLRFFSSMSTVHLFEDRVMEIFMGSEDECFSSCLSSDRWRALELAPTSTERTSAGYLVSRNLVRPTPSATNVTAFRVTERVSRDGKVEVLAEEPIPISLLDQARLTFPGYL